jgi:hypothetical protein
VIFIKKIYVLLIKANAKGMRTNKSKKTKVGTNMLDNGCKFEHFIAESGVKTPKIK